jgi:hypothetical protein
MIVASGLASPDASGAYSVMLLAPELATHRSPAGSTVTPAGPTRPVSRPEMTVSGWALPFAPGAKTMIALAAWSAT